ncbi:MAG TPA: cob(I)yrinic acid a,c-diamide adenosyltransferase, partial [Nitrospirae bacterium]|nr:cob(I)yrinic acid a,c-diamide adenosyltransferase [Nitrospirota bacterium]
DEFNNLVRTRIIDEKDALSFMDDIPEGSDLVLTGRGATKGMLDLADYITYMKAVKHPLQMGLNARKGIEY